MVSIVREKQGGVGGGTEVCLRERLNTAQSVSL